MSQFNVSYDGKAMGLITVDIEAVAKAWQSIDNATVEVHPDGLLVITPANVYIEWVQTSK